ncbi:uncharacterized protein LOC111251475 isoform X2 [Varroa destructor]|uniref:Uncharacterized protein n=1 Tax=Varroa destructor TaxID=109461 RepID=A0A7M7KCR0_VARDE|nr:uncharacterized protein LOC111251475 isoform X2 [Varroa destructor]
MAPKRQRVGKASTGSREICTERILVLLCMLSLWTDGAISAPLQSSSGRGSGHVINGIPTWTSPCGQDGLGDIPEVKTWSQLQSLLLEIGRHARISSLEAGHKKKLFLENRYNDSTSFESLYQQYVHDWLPRPPATPEDFEKTFEEMNVTTAFRKVYGYLQHYAVGLEQATLDQMFTRKGGFDGHFREVQNSLKQLLCEFDMSISMLKIRKDPDVLRDVMSVEQRKPVDALGEHQIMLRDYVILRDFISITEYVSRLFTRLAKHPEKRPENVLNANRTKSH